MQDQKFYLEKPDVGFSPKRNREIIRQSILNYEKMREQKAHEYDEAYAERASAVVSYLKFCMGKPGYKLDQYFSKQEIEHLMGMDVKLQLMNNIKQSYLQQKMNGKKK